MASNFNILITLLEDSNKPSIEKEIEVLKGHERWKCFRPWDELDIEYVPSG